MDKMEHQMTALLMFTPKEKLFSNQAERQVGECHLAMD